MKIKLNWEIFFLLTFIRGETKKFMVVPVVIINWLIITEL